MQDNTIYDKTRYGHAKTRQYKTIQDNIRQSKIWQNKKYKPIYDNMRQDKTI